jgi:hypothetical protein
MAWWLSQFLPYVQCGLDITLHQRAHHPH